MTGWRNGLLAATAIALSLSLSGPACAEPGDQGELEQPAFRRLPAVADEQDETVKPGVDPPPGIAESDLAGIVVPAPKWEIEAGTAEPAAWPENSRPEQLRTPPPTVHAATPNQHAHAHNRLISEYQSWVNASPDQGRWWMVNDQEALPSPDVPWWDEQMRRPLNAAGEPLGINIAELCNRALLHSSFVQVIATEPHIRESELVAEAAEFDWRVFLETTYDDVNEPVGNTLTTGTNADRYKNRVWSLDSGLRRRNALGGEVELFQRFGSQADNSRFLVPNPQSTTRLELQYTQPLLKGGGRPYNESRIVLARLQLDQATDRVAEQLEAHLVKVTEAYWELYRTRAEFLQRNKLLNSAVGIQASLEGRRAVDAVERQVFRARTAVANRKSELVRAETRIRNWQSQLRLLVNDPVLVHAGGRELTPVDSPILWQVPVSMTDTLHLALLNRADISQAIRGVRGAAVELGVAEQDVLPKLDFVVSTYIAGLAGEANSRRAFGDQFSRGRPAYSVGLEFEIPVGNRAAQVQVSRRQWEMNRAVSRFRLTVEEALTRVEIAVREVETSYRQMVAKFQAVQAAQNEADYLDDRWRILPGISDSAAQLLENLLDAQERLAEEEGAMVRAQITYALALVNLKSEMGTLLRVGEQ